MSNKRKLIVYYLTKWMPAMDTLMYPDIEPLTIKVEIKNQNYYFRISVEYGIFHECIKFEPLRNNIFRKDFCLLVWLRNMENIKYHVSETPLGLLKILPKSIGYYDIYQFLRKTKKAIQDKMSDA